MKPDSSSQEKLASWIVDQLHRQGTESIFLLPGFHIAAICQALEMNPQIRIYCSRHEQTCAFMAMGYAIIRRTPGVFATIAGPGILNAAAAMSSAHACNVPLFGLVGLVTSKAKGKNIGLLHEIPNQLDMFSNITRYHAELSSDRCPYEVFDQASLALQAERPGPVLLGIPEDLSNKPVPERKEVLSSNTQVTQDLPRELEAAIKLFSDAKNPLIVAGSGAEDSLATLQSIAERSGTPIVMSVNLRGRIDNNGGSHLAHPFTLREHLKVADVVLAVGTRLVDFQSLELQNSKMKLIRLDVCQERVQEPYAASYQLVGKANLILKAWNESLGKSVNINGNSRVQELNYLVDQRLSAIEPHYEYASAIAGALPDDAIVTVDSTQFGYYWMYYWNPGPNGRTITTGHMGTLGSALPLALGAKVAAPTRPVVAICGDGGLMMSLQDLATGAEYELGVTIILFDDQGYGELRKLQRTTYPSLKIGTMLKNPDFRMLAEAHRVQYFKPNTSAEAKLALTQAIDSKRLSIVHISCDMLVDLKSLIL